MIVLVTETKVAPRRRENKSRIVVRLHSDTPAIFIGGSAEGLSAASAYGQSLGWRLCTVGFLAHKVQL